jgi:hypothetical protein
MRLADEYDAAQEPRGLPLKSPAGTAQRGRWDRRPSRPGGLTRAQIAGGQRANFAVCSGKAYAWGPLTSSEQRAGTLYLSIPALPQLSVEPRSNVRVERFLDDGCRQHVSLPASVAILLDEGLAAAVARLDLNGKAIEVLNLNLMLRQTNPDEDAEHAEVPERVLPCPLEIMPARVVVADEIDDRDLPGFAAALVQHLGHVMLQLERAISTR